MQLLIETDIESGLRWGELTELRPRDLDFSTGVLTVSRVVVELSPKFHPDGGRFVVKDYPKDQEHRRLKLSGQIVAKIKAFIEAHGIGDDDLLFAMPFMRPTPSARASPASSTATFSRTVRRTRPSPADSAAGILHRGWRRPGGCKGRAALTGRGHGRELPPEG
jgi:integrase